MKRNPFGAFLDKVSPPEGLFLLTLSVVIGASTGLAAVFFIHLIAIIQNRSYGTVQFLFPHLGVWSYVFVPIGGALIAGPLIAWFAREAKGHGVPVFRRWHPETLPGYRWSRVPLKDNCLV